MRAKREKPEKRLAYDVKEVAEQLNCSRRTVYNLITDGTLASIKIGKLRRVPHAELMRLIAEAQ